MWAAAASALLLLLLLLLQRLLIVLRVEILNVLQDNLHPRKEGAVITPRKQAPKQAAASLIELPDCQKLYCSP